MYLTTEQLDRALALRDLTDPADGHHAIQLLIEAVTSSLLQNWDISLRRHRGERIVAVADNYDRLGYPPDGPARDARYTRYVSDARLLRTQTSACVPGALRDLRGVPREELLAIPGIVYRRDSIDRLHTGEPHQLDLWRLSSSTLGTEDLREMISLVVEALLPGSPWRATETTHPYTTDGLEVEVEMKTGEWVELLECGLAHPNVIEEAGLSGCHGLAMGIGLDRALMLRKGIPDIRQLRATDERVASQMLDLDPYVPVSDQPPARRDMSVMCAPGLSVEEIGDRVREMLGDDAELVEEVSLVSRTPVSELPLAAVERMGAREGQENLLIRIVARHPTHSISKAEANLLRDRIYEGLHEGDRSEYASSTA